MKWNPQLYDDKHNFVYEYGKALLDLLNPLSHEHILDVGCGTGVLTKSIAQIADQVLGLDKSPEMVARAQKAYPELVFINADVANFQLSQTFDAIFSNATLHWVLNFQGAADNLYKHLKPGGRLVVEFGGAGNVQNIVSALRETLAENGFKRQAAKKVWYFPTPRDYQRVLEHSGFSVEYCQLHPRPTLLKDHDEGIADWLRMFGQAYFESLEAKVIEKIIKSTEEKLVQTNYINHQWVADYVRIRVVAIRKPY